MVARKFTQEAGIRMTHIPYSGTAPGYQALIRGDIQMYPDIVMSAYPHIKAGTFKALAIAAEQRHPLLPDVPTMAESGFNNFVMSVWYGLNVPAGTPPGAMNRLVKAIDKALTDPTMVAEFANRGLVLYPPGGPQLMKAQVEADKKRWEPVIRSLNLKGDE